MASFNKINIMHIHSTTTCIKLPGSQSKCDIVVLHCNQGAYLSELHLKHHFLGDNLQAIQRLLSCCLAVDPGHITDAIGACSSTIRTQHCVLERWQHCAFINTDGLSG